MTAAFRFPRFAVGYALTVGPLREHPGRAVLAVAAIALGVALGVAVHLINASAVSEFGAAARHLAGRADLVVRGPRAGFDESLYPRLARHRGVEAANPGIELDVPLAGRDGTIRVLGFDPLRAAEQLRDLAPADVVKWLQQWSYDMVVQGAAGGARYNPDFRDDVARAGRKAALHETLRFHRQMLGWQRFIHHPLNPRLFLEELLLSYGALTRTGRRSETG